MSDEQKASADLRRFLVEKFFAGGTKPEAVVIQGDSSSGQYWAEGVQERARDLGLMARIVEITPDLEESEVDDRRWVVVGPKKSTAAGAAYPIMETIEERNDPVRDREEAEAKQQQQQLEAAMDECDDWDVTGTYKISCPHIEEQWGHLDQLGNGLTLSVHRKATPRGAQMYAKFDFICATGVFRFERHKRDVKTTPSSPDDTQKRKRNPEESGDESDKDDYDEEEVDIWDESRRGPTPEAFYFGSIPQPSAECRTWRYRWRGEDTGTNEIQLYSDEDLYEIKWYGPRVEKLKGTFGGSFFDECSFTGVKVGICGELDDIDIADEWASRNEQAHTRAGRW